ncbi:Stk1 family PASTA domain-containing Ser/Thr kinase [Kineococcus rubinsiae]|uniref:Stk1 family PASTA domain-containing Ser/Thr kinase n=1 Tax=Kineococcus rubinsiae TaxID=2609562 RepID=UPI0014300943|nr:Stk1 family PASTA domain-containing Ser/Thr kinase [Kineococcus rubinsiae]NIZ90748.1 Stk1 family PASTA domain-containing Ser/Thr kinase [Kineococcus rubinsiae]
MVDADGGYAGTGEAGARRLLGGRYEVGSLLGRGGMAEVHVARDTRLGRTVAVKLLRADLARDPSFQARFRREAQSAASLNHSSIVAVYDTGADPSPQPGGGSVDLPYIVMEYVEGRTLRDMLKTDHPLALSESLKITEGVLAALEYSHRMGIVHRDIKPANVMITPAGEVKVMDFGIARAVSDSSATLTQTSAVMGTAQYLSPEQARGEQVDARSDLYSAGCLLYEVLTGRPPFVGDAPVAVAYQHVSEQPRPPSALEPGIPPAVDHVVLMALSKDREHRYQSAADFADDLRRAVEGRPLRGATVGALPTPAPAAADATRVVPTVAAPLAATATGALPRVGDDDPLEEERRRRWPWVLLVLVLLLGVGGVAYALSQTGGGGTPTSTPSPTATPVPEVVGQTQEAAETALTDAGLTSTVVQAPSDDQPAGTVVSSDPAAGTSAVLGSAVALTVSSGPSAVTVPGLAGSTQDQAREQLAQAGLTVGSVETTDEDPKADKGSVVRTDPGADASVAPGTPVKLFVASGQVTVPELVGQARDAARAQLNALGLQVNIDTRESSDASPGQVLSQSVTEGSTVDVGSEVDLVVASAPPSTPSPSTSSPTSSPTASPSASSPDPTDSPTSTAAAGAPGNGNGNGKGNGNGNGNGNGGGKGDG